VSAVLFLTSIAVIYLQIGLMRYLSYIYYGTFTSLVIGLALIGFGAGGTFLALNQRRIGRREAPWLIGFACLTGLGIIGGLLAVDGLLLNLAYLFYDSGELLKFLVVVLALVPAFFGGGSLIGRILVTGGRDRGLLYGINLFGSGMGGLLAVLAMYRFTPAALPALALIPMAGVLFLLSSRFKGTLRIGGIAIAISWILFVFIWQPSDRVDQYKDLATMRFLENQGEASLIASSNSPYGRLEAFSSPSFHHVLFANLSAGSTPPEQMALFRNGDLIGAPFVIGGAAILDDTASSLVYKLTSPRRVLIIGDSGLTGLQAALRAGAEEVTLLLPDPHLEGFLRNELSQVSGYLFSRSEIEVVVGDYRRFLLEHRAHFDVINMAAAESLAAPSSGLYAAREDYLLTIEAIGAARDALNSGGIITITRGIQSPPRDNLKLFLTLHKALKEDGVTEPADYLLQARGYLALVTMISRDPIGGPTITRFREICREWDLDIEYEPGAEEAAPDHYSFRLPGPEGSGDSWYRFTSRLVADGKSADLIESWIFDIRPPTDDRPFFHSFFRWRNLDEFAVHYGRYWFRRSDLGSLVLAVTLITVTFVSFLLILLPHITGGARLRPGFLGYFPAIGLGFLFLEILMIQRASLYLGHPQVSVPIVLTMVLTSSGIGSLLQARLKKDLFGKLALALPLLAVSFAVFLIPTTLILKLTALLDRLGRLVPILFIALLAGIPAFFMGWFFAPGLDRLEEVDPETLPTAWALNGFASVVASPLAVLLSMSQGFIVTGGMAIAAYTVAVILAFKQRSADIVIAP
jgi:hypothetical protein